MIFKSPKQPFCRFCGKPIAKHTHWVELTTKRTEFQKDTSWSHYIVVPKLPQSKAECQTLTNEKVVSVKRTHLYDRNLEKTEESYIHSFHTWDGESYRDQYFCNRTQCAVSYAYMVVEKSNLVSVAYNDSVRRQRGEKIA